MLPAGCVGVLPGTSEYAAAGTLPPGLDEKLRELKQRGKRFQLVVAAGDGWAVLAYSP